jgi:DNA gyrase subunit B
MSDGANQLHESPAITKLLDRDHVRERFGMYIGDNGTFGLHHLAYELINNSMDEARAGHATQFSVTIHHDGSLSVQDDGRGMSVDRDEQKSELLGRDVSVLEVEMTTLPVPGKFDKKTYKPKRKFGIGLKAVNFLSKSCTATVWRGGSEYQLSFEEGLLAGDLQRIGDTKKHGTRITFRPDPEIFSTVDFDFVRLQARLRELAILHPNVIARIHDERTIQFQFARGISQLADELAASQLGCSEVFRLEAEGGGAQIEIAFEFTLYYGQQIRLYVNDQLAHRGGTPVVGLLAGITRAMSDNAKANRLDVPANLSDEFSQRLGAVIAIRHCEPHYAGGTRDELINPDLIGIVDSAVHRYLLQRFTADPDLAAQQWKIARQAAERRMDEEKSWRESESDDTNN